RQGGAVGQQGRSQLRVPAQRPSRRPQEALVHRDARHPTGAAGGAVHQGHAAEEHVGPGNGPQTQGLCHARPPAHGATTPAIRDHPGRPVTIDPVSTNPETSEPVHSPSEDPRDAVTTPQTPHPDTAPAAPVGPAPLGPAMPVPSGQTVQAVGRRKEAVVRVRLVPGTGVFRLNGTSLERYFPNKVHQQLIREPLLTVNKPEAYDVLGNLSGGGTSGQAGALRLAI